MNHVRRNSLLEDDDVTPLSRPSSSQRLTKPRTNTNSTLTATNRRDSSSIRSISSKPSSRGVTGTTGEGERNLAAESPLSAANESHVCQFAPGAEHDGSSLGSPLAVSPGLTSRSASVSTADGPSNRHSIACDGSALDINAAVALLQQLRKNASPEDLIALHRALLPSRTAEYEDTDIISESHEPDEAFFPLIRRSSLLPAGIATRIPSFDATKRRLSKGSSPYEHRRSGPQLPRRQSGTWEEFAQGGFDAVAPDARIFRPRPGTATPSDLQISHTGNYQLGSLRVINGAASPEPRSRAVSSEVGQQDTPPGPPCQIPTSRVSEMPRLPGTRSRSFGSPFVTASGSESLRAMEDTSHQLTSTGGPEEALEQLNGITRPKTTRNVSSTSDVSAKKSGSQLFDMNPLEQSAAPSSLDSGRGLQAPCETHAGVPTVIASDDNSDMADRVIAEGGNRDAPGQVTAMPGSPSEPAPAAETLTPTKPKTSMAQLFQRRQSMPVSNPSASEIGGTPTAAVPMKLADEKTKKQHKKLRKARPQSQQHFSVQSLPVTTTQSTPEDHGADQPPDVPDNVKINFSRRLDHRRISPWDETFNPVEETAWKHFKDLEGSSGTEDQGRGRARDEESASESPKAEKRKSILGHLRSRSRSKSRHNSSTIAVEHEPVLSLLDLKSMAAPLGQSPYDIATVQRRSLDDPRPLNHLHESMSVVSDPFTSMGDETAASHARQSTSAMPKPFTSMDDETAALYARSKSRDIAEQHASERRARSSSRQRLPRPVSAHPRLVPSVATVPEIGEVVKRVRPFRVGTIKFEGGEAQGRMSPIMVDMRRPKSHRHSVSPRPALPWELEKVPDLEQGSIASPKFEPATFNGPKPVTPVTAAPAPAVTNQPSRSRNWRQRNQSAPDASATKVLDNVRDDDQTPAVPNSSKSDVERFAPVLSMEHRRLGSETQPLQKSPAIVVSRYVTPTSADRPFEMEVASDKDPYAGVAAANPTDHLPAKEDVDRTDSAISYKTLASHKSYASSSTRGSGGSHLAYQQMQPARMSKQKPAPERHGRSRSHTAGPTRTITAPEYDRFSGGLGYGWERGSGFGGSAGTRQGSDQAAKRRSVHLSESWGVDLSDVPVFMTRA